LKVFHIVSLNSLALQSFAFIPRASFAGFFFLPPSSIPDLGLTFILTSGQSPAFNDLATHDYVYPASFIPPLSYRPKRDGFVSPL